MSAPVGGRRWTWQAGFVVVVLVAAAGLLAGPYRFLVGNVAGSAEQPAREAPCLPGEPVAILDSPHISQREAGSADYNSRPPTSGPHFAYTIAAGVYDDPVPDGLTIHAMEHGHVVIHYAPDVAADQLAGLRRVARKYAADVVLTPNPTLTDGIALTAWGQVDRLDRFDERRITGFVEALRGRYDHGWSADQDCPAG